MNKTDLKGLFISIYVAMATTHTQKKVCVVNLLVVIFGERWIKAFREIDE